jgi:hypothetical protein
MQAIASGAGTNLVASLIHMQGGSSALTHKVLQLLVAGLPGLALSSQAAARDGALVYQWIEGPPIRGQHIGIEGQP